MSPEGLQGRLFRSTHALQEGEHKRKTMVFCEHLRVMNVIRTSTRSKDLVSESWWTLVPGNASHLVPFASTRTERPTLLASFNTVGVYCIRDSGSQTGSACFKAMHSGASYTIQ